MYIAFSTEIAEIVQGYLNHIVKASYRGHVAYQWSTGQGYKKEQNKLKKEKKNAEDKVKKLEKALGKTGNRTKSGQIPETESAYQEKQDCNKVCVVDIANTILILLNA